MSRWLWPIVNATPLLPDCPGSFGAKRKFDVHSGVDLYCEPGAQIVAVEDGRVVCVEQFTGQLVASGPTSFWNNTMAVLVQGESGVVVYGEIAPAVSVGKQVFRGDIIGHVVPVLKRFKGRPTSMLHVELIDPEVAGFYQDPNWNHWGHDKPCPAGLIDPTPFLREAAPDVRVFDLATYTGDRFRG